jgi:hypothetical protein
MELVLISQNTENILDAKGKYYDPAMSYKLHQWHYYLTWFSLMNHLLIMSQFLGNWCGV